MNFDNRLFKILYYPHISEKSSMNIKKNNTVVVKVHLKSKKSDIKNAFQKIFSLNVDSINTILVKGKVKKKGKYNIYRNNWKKAYIKIKKGQNLDFIKNIN